MPDDFAHFKNITLGKPIVMGRRTWESIGKALPGRTNIVVTRQAGLIADGAVVVDSIAAALAAAGDAAEVVIIGGAGLYTALLPRASRIYLTRVDAEPDGDTFFSQPDPTEWSLTSCEAHVIDERHAHPFEFRVYDRR